jgi:ABC-type uncharacterized transport system auxiliary subunit
MIERRRRSSGLTLSGLVLAGAALLSATGCWLWSGHLPARELYRLTLPDSSEAGAGSALATDGAPPPLAGTLAITQYATPGIYGDPQIVFRLNDNQYGSYSSSSHDREWAVPLGEQLGVLTERVLARVPLTAERAVFDPPSRRSQTYIWRGTVREFEEVNRGSQVLAAVRIDARIARAEDDSIVWSGSARLERAASPANMSGIVQTLSTLATEVVADLATRARHDLATRVP